MNIMEMIFSLDFLLIPLIIYMSHWIYHWNRWLACVFFCYVFLNLWCFEKKSHYSILIFSFLMIFNICHFFYCFQKCQCGFHLVGKLNEIPLLFTISEFARILTCCTFVCSCDFNSMQCLKNSLKNRRELNEINSWTLISIRTTSLTYSFHGEMARFFIHVSRKHFLTQVSLTH